MAGMEFMASNRRSAAGRNRAYCLALLMRSKNQDDYCIHYSLLCFAVLSNDLYFDSALLREALLNLKVPRQMYVHAQSGFVQRSSHH